MACRDACLARPGNSCKSFYYKTGACCCATCVCVPFKPGQRLSEASSNSQASNLRPPEQDARCRLQVPFARQAHHN